MQLCMAALQWQPSSTLNAGVGVGQECVQAEKQWEGGIIQRELGCLSRNLVCWLLWIPAGGSGCLCHRGRVTGLRKDW